MKINLREIISKAEKDRESLSNIELEIYNYFYEITIGIGLKATEKLEDKEIFKDIKQDILLFRLRLERDRYKYLSKLHSNDYCKLSQRIWTMKKLLSVYEKRNDEDAHEWLKNNNTFNWLDAVND